MEDELFNLKYFEYDLPKEAIRQEGLKDRSKAKLMVIDRRSKSISHHLFEDIINFVDSSCTLVLNDTKVINARLKGYKERSGGKVEVLLLKKINNNCWEALVKPAGRIKENDVLVFNEMKGKVKSKGTTGRLIEFDYSGNFYELLDRVGEVPTPPYIHKKLEDKNSYQSVFAKTPGSIAAPTASLHFTEELLNKLRNKGVNICFITLHINIDTFLPVKEVDIREHKMYSEYFEIKEDTAEIINHTKLTGGKIIACGTTSVRTLEQATENNRIASTSGYTNLYIYPGYNFKAVDYLITNFHAPRSTNLILVCAFATRELIMKAYQEALNKDYKFLSFGDCMLIM